MEWISVKENIPRDADNYLCYRQHDEWITVCWYSGGIFYTEPDVQAHLISHWMPLPPPPKD
jgi:hypothetical protein